MLAAPALRLRPRPVSHFMPPMARSQRLVYPTSRISPPRALPCQCAYHLPTSPLAGLSAWFSVMAMAEEETGSSPLGW